MRIVDLINKKREGGVHSRAELDAIVDGYVRGAVPDYQVAAWLMAVCWRGMHVAELADLTRVMAASGQQLDLASIGRPVADKHSTGGVGDKTSLIVMPLVAACGVPVAKMSGRGLGFTGGTIDKLESFAGMRVDLDAEAFVRQLRDIGIVISGQSADLAPADGKLYALRDATGTVPSLPLIASSIMSKKLAAGAQVIVLDVKTGSGAFMREPESAMALARAMVDIGTAAGRRMAAVVSDMSQPLGRSVGNSLEVAEALDTLAGGGQREFTEFATDLASTIVALASDGALGRSEVDRALHSGGGLQMFRRLVEAQGGDTRGFDDRRCLPRARVQRVLTAEADGYLARLDALMVAHASSLLGAGRERKSDPIDLSAGVVLAAKVGEHVVRGQPLATLHANDASRLAQAEAVLRSAVEISAEQVAVAPLILERISG
ncbi:MAG: thymidine phosphorylase [Chloroflexi bacterium]|nr:thymidine phosphorylase [Chloroflexota bacterium]MBV9595846.1 thymidine phosphorylase [Chloroflexota bacterium]